MTQTLKRGLVAVLLAGASGLSLAQSALPDASTQIAAVTTSLAGYAVVMFALALAAVGIMVGVKWIKRARGAA